MWTSAVVLLIAMLLGFAAASVDQWSALSVQVEPKSDECFYEVMDAGKTFEMDFEVVRGGLLDIEVVISDPSLNVVYRRLAFFNHEDPAENEREGIVSFTSSYSGQYSICFNNKMSRWTPKVVSFGVRDTSTAKKPEAAKLEHLGPVVDSVVKISDTLEKITKLQHYLRVREQAHRDTQESTNSRVSWFTIAEAIVLISISGFQIYYIQNLFGDAKLRRRV